MYRNRFRSIRLVKNGNSTTKFRFLSIKYLKFRFFRSVLTSIGKSLFNFSSETLSGYPIRIRFALGYWRFDCYCSSGARRPTANGMFNGPAHTSRNGPRTPPAFFAIPSPQSILLISHNVGSSHLSLSRTSLSQSHIHPPIASMNFLLVLRWLSPRLSWWPCPVLVVNIAATTQITAVVNVFTLLDSINACFIKFSFAILPCYFELNECLVICAHFA